MMPLKDINPTRRLPIATYLLILINVLVFVWELSLTPEELQRQFMMLAVVPANLNQDGFLAIESMLDIVRSMFLHGGFEHILGNMLFLYLFGDNTEDRLGTILFVILYFISGIVATVAQFIIDPSSTIPNIGASGAIAGVLGSYLVMFPSVKVRGIVGLGRVGAVQEWPAWIVLGMWFVLQLVSGFASLGAEAQYGGGVAFFAHIGGFIAGVLLTLLFTRFVRQPSIARRQGRVYQRSR